MDITFTRYSKTFFISLDRKDREKTNKKGRDFVYGTYKNEISEKWDTNE